jgi:hypothetical protein
MTNPRSPYTSSTVSAAINLSKVVLEYFFACIKDLIYFCSFVLEQELLLFHMQLFEVVLFLHLYSLQLWQFGMELLAQ